MTRATTLYLVRHAQSQPSADVAEPQWPLSELGRAQALALASALRPLGIDTLYTSPYPRARDTLAPFAAAVGKPLLVEHDLHERVLTRAYLADAWAATLERYWSDPDYALADGESNRACARRVVAAIERLCARHPGETLALASHGNAIALYLGTIDPGFGYEQWRAMRNPDLFCVRYQDGRASWDGARLPTAL